MKKHSRRFFLPLFLMLVALFAGCTSPETKQENQNDSLMDYFKKTEGTCEAILSCR
jgi:hypothetical protein